MIVILLIALILLIASLYKAIGHLLNAPYAMVELSNLSVDIQKTEELRAYIHVDVFYLSLSYQYEYEGNCYTGHKIGISDGLKFDDIAKAEKFADQYKNMAQCYVSTKRPDISYLSKSLSVGPSDSTYGMLGASIFVFALYLFLLY